MTIQEAVQLAIEGKEEGFNFLYHETYNKGHYVALSYMKQEEDAMDVLQNSYIKAFNNLNQLNDPASFGAWFSRIVATKALDELKKRKMVLFSQIGDDENIGVEEMFVDDRINAQPELSKDKAETTRLVKEMLDTLNPEQRMCITMFYMEEMSIKEIAEVLNVSENTVKSRLNYGRKSIKTKVEDLEKRGTKLYGIAPVPFFIWLLLSDVKTVKAAPAPTQIPAAFKPMIPVNSTANVAAEYAGTIARTVAKNATTSVSTKVIIGIISVAIIAGASATVGLAIHNNSSDSNTSVTIADTTEESTTETIEDEVADVTEESTEETTEQTIEETTEETVADVTYEYDESVALENYKTVLNDYYNNIFYGSFDYDGSQYFPCNDLDAIGYYFWDMDNDGEVELFIGTVDSRYNRYIMEAFTLVDGEPVSLAKTSSWSMVFICSDKYLEIDDSTISISFYQLEDGELVEKENHEFPYTEGVHLSAALPYTPFSSYQVIE